MKYSKFLFSAFVALFLSAGVSAQSEKDNTEAYKASLMDKKMTMQTVEKGADDKENTYTQKMTVLTPYGDILMGEAEVTREIEDDGDIKEVSEMEFKGTNAYGIEISGEVTQTTTLDDEELEQTTEIKEYREDVSGNQVVETKEIFAEFDDGDELVVRSNTRTVVSKAGGKNTTTNTSSKLKMDSDGEIVIESDSDMSSTDGSSSEKSTDVEIDEDGEMKKKIKRSKTDADGNTSKYKKVTEEDNK